MIFIVLVTGLRAGFEDYKRHEADHRRNWMKTIKLGNWENQNYIKQNQSKFSMYYHTILSKLSFRPYKNADDEENEIIEDHTNSEIPLIELNSNYNSTECLKSRKESMTKRENSNYSDKRSVKEKEIEPPKWINTTWQDLHVGDFVLLKENDLIPADILVVSTSEPDNLCYLETKNLDGETNLKVRQGISDFKDVNTPEKLASIKCYLDADSPNNNLYTFKGVLHKKDDDNDEDDEESQTLCTINSMLLRECILKNTRWVIGLVIYTGFHTKSVLNMGESPSKRSKIEKQMNPQVLMNFLILAVMCVVCAITHYLYIAAFKNEGAQFWSGEDPNDTEQPILAALKTLINSLILYQNIIPIALYVSVEISKTVQAYFIYSDGEIFDEELNKPTLAKSWNLSDDLGQIEYVFSDKTGTLTRNVMDFRKCSINGVIYGNSYITEAQLGNKNSDEKENIDSEKVFEDELDKMRKYMKKIFTPIYVSDEPAFADSTLFKHILEDGDQASYIKEFFILLATCNTVLTESIDKNKNKAMPKNEDDSSLNISSEKDEANSSNGSIEKDNTKLTYRAQSPDEGALVEGARDLGFTLLKRHQSTLTLDVFGEEQIFEALQVIEFDSDRKRMSVIFRTPNNEIVIFCKGADSVIFERLAQGQDQIKEDTLNHLQEFATEGLRTLCLGYRVIEEEEFNNWHKRYQEASYLAEENDQIMSQLADEVENNFILLGATAIEDKLQEGVPECIATLSKAGIKIWVLTGDKLETAINIGFACNLLNHNMQIIVIRGDDENDTYNQLVKALSSFWTEDGTDVYGNPYSLVIDGQSLKHALETKSKALLLELSCRCKAVICCRVSPLQKAKVVQLVRKGLGAMCMAVGDGANDISMIQEADIGIGINGKEGAQAVMSADYAIGQFRFLTRLLLVHGRWAYMRTANLILTYFYKNVVWLFVLFWYQFYCSFSAAILYDYNYTLFFTTIFTLLLNMNIGIFDQDINDRIAIALPQLYSSGIRGTLYTMQKFWVYIAYGIYESLVAFFIGVFMYNNGSTSPKGYDAGQEVMGNMVAVFLIISINVIMAITTYSWTKFTWASLILTLGVWLAYVFIYASSSTSLTYGIISRMFGEPAFYIAAPLYFVLVLAPRFIKKYVQVTYLPNDIDIVREINKYKIRIPDLPDNYEFDDEAYRLKKERRLKKREERKKARQMLWKKQKENFKKMASILNPKVNYIYYPTTKNETKVTADISMSSPKDESKSSSENSPDMPKSEIPNKFKTKKESSKLFPSSVRSPTSTSIHSAGTTSAVTTPQQNYVYNVLKAQVLVKAFNTYFPKLKIKDYFHNINQAKENIPSGIVYMNDEKFVSNTGFCYSQESGMKEIITPGSNGNTVPTYETMKGGERTEWDNSIPKYKNFRRTRSLNESNLDSYSKSKYDDLKTKRFRTYQTNLYSKSVDQFEKDVANKNEGRSGSKKKSKDKKGKKADYE